MYSPVQNSGCDLLYSMWRKKWHSSGSVRKTFGDSIASRCSGDAASKEFTGDTQNNVHVFWVDFLRQEAAVNPKIAFDLVPQKKRTNGRHADINRGRVEDLENCVSRDA